MVSPNNSATESTRALGHLLLSKGIESVKMISSILDFMMSSEALPDMIGCVTIARTLSAPSAIMRSAALQRVFAVSTMSSIRITFFPLTSPMICILATSLAFSLVLWHKTREAWRCLANALARLDPPTSGDAMTRSLSFRLLMNGMKTVDALRWSTGTLKNP